MRVGALVGATAAALLLAACSSGDGAERASPTPSPSPSAPPSPSFTPEGPPRVERGFKRVVVGAVGIAVPRSWSACRFGIVLPTGLDGPTVAFAPPGARAGLFSPLRFQVDPPPGDKLFDARSWGSRYSSAAVWIAFGTSIFADPALVARPQLVAQPGRWDRTGRASASRGSAGCRGGKRIEPVYRDIAASIEFGVEEVPTPLARCSRR